MDVKNIVKDEQKQSVWERHINEDLRFYERDWFLREWRRLHDSDLYALYASNDIIDEIKSKRLRWDGHVAQICTYRILVSRSTETPRYR